MTEVDPLAASKQPHPRWNAKKPGERHPQSLQAWDWQEHRSIEDSLRRLAVSGDYADPRVPDQMALVTRRDLLHVTGDYVRLRAWQQIVVEKAAQQDREAAAVEKRLSEIVSDAEIARVHGHANFGATMSPRDVVNEGVRKTAVGYHCGHTQFSILREHGLITKPKPGSYDADLTKKGKRYARALYDAPAAALAGGDR